MANYDLANLALQCSSPSNVLLYDDMGDPSVMVRIPKFKIGDVIEGGGDGTHPAFIINGEEKDCIYISKYQNIVNNGRAYSLPMQDPAVNVNFETAYNYCKAKGKGWHLMTNAEFAAIALWCKKNGTMPKGNNNYGKDISEASLPQKALAASYGSDGRINRTATGSGRASWFHDGTEAGIADLNGNVWEWNSGLRLYNGEIQILENNNAADYNNPISATSQLWKAILPDGTLVAPGTDNTLKINGDVTGDDTKTDHRVGNPVLDTKRDKPAYTGGDVNDYYGTLNRTFETFSAASGVNVPMIVKALGIYPADSEGYEGDYIYVRNYGERLPIRGGPWTSTSYAGVFSLALSYPRAHSSAHIGFRSAYYD